MCQEVPAGAGHGAGGEHDGRGGRGGLLLLSLQTVEWNVINLTPSRGERVPVGYSKEGAESNVHPLGVYNGFGTFASD